MAGYDRKCQNYRAGSFSTCAAVHGISWQLK